MSKRAAIAATSVLAVGGSLAVVSSASAASMPVSSTTGPSLTAVQTQAADGLVQSAEALNNVGDTQMAGITAASDVTTTNAKQIVADFTGASFQGTAPSSASYAATLSTGDPNYATDAKNTVVAGTGYEQVSSLINLSDAASSSFPNGLFTVDGDLAVSSTATVKATSAPTAVSVTLGTTSAASKGFVLPSAFTLTFPKSYGINLALAGDELPSADEANPTSDKAIKPIGSVTLSTPAVQYLTGLPNAPTTLTGSIYAVQVGSSPTDVALEIYFDIDGISAYNLSSQFTSLAFPLTTSFGEFDVSGSSNPLPVSSMTLSFPAALSPVEAGSCSSLGTITATATDDAAALASTFGDTTDGWNSSTSTASPVSLASTPTTVTNDCAVATTLSASKGSATGVSKGKPAFGFTLGSNKAFSSFTVTLPKGFSYSKFSSKDLKVTGGSVKKVSASGSKLTVTLTSATKSVAAKISKGIKETSSAKKDKSVTLKLGANGKSASLKIKA